MFDRDEFLVLVSALNKLDIKGSDAMYIASLISKINGEINKIDEEAIKSQKQLDEIKKLTKEKK